MNARPVVILDLADVIVENRGRAQASSDCRLLPETVPALRRLSPMCELVMVLDASDVGPDRVDIQAWKESGRPWLAELAAGGVQARFLCSGPAGRREAGELLAPEMRKVFEAGEELNLDGRAVFLVGAPPPNIGRGARAGAQELYIRSDRRTHPTGPPRGSIVVPGLREAADWILGEVESRRRMHNPERAIRAAAVRLRGGGVVAFPTETVYGLGANIFDPRAIARIFEIKGRPRFDPLIVHVVDADAARSLVEFWPEKAAMLAERFWPGPLTIVLRKLPCVPDLVTAGLPTVALRCPRHPVAWRLLRETGVPMAAPSANRFGGVSPTTADAVVEQLGDAPDALLDGGPCPVGIESTIVALEEGEGVLLRPGGASVEEIEAVIGPLRHVPATDRHPRSPGRLPRHYAPRTPLRLFDVMPRPNPRAGLLAFRMAPPPGTFAAVEVLSPSGDLREAAARFFEALREMDSRGLEVIYAQTVPETGLGVAINDRLRRAAARERSGE